MELITYTWSYFVQVAGLTIAFIFAGVFLFLALRHFRSLWMRVALVAVFLGVSLFFYAPNGLPQSLSYPLQLATYGPGDGPILPLKNAWEFLTHFDDFERVADISRDPNDVPPPLNRTEPEHVYLELTAKEVIDRKSVV